MDIPPEKLTRILAAAVQAPSGDNTQPWRFQIKADTVRLLNVPEKDTSPLNYQQASNYIALGAALENLRIAAESEGFKTDITFFPDNSDAKIVAEIVLQECGSDKNELAPYIAERASNRRKYSPEAIQAEALAELSKSAETFAGRITFVTDRENIDAVAHAVSAGEKLALENKDIHDFLFEHVTWTQEDEIRRHGFYIKTFEFKPPQELIFKLFKNWNVLSFFQKFGITDFIAKDMESVYRSSGAFGAIIIEGRSKESLVRAGMALERVWLTATKMELGIQATTSVHLLELPIRDDASTLTVAHQELIKERYKILENSFKLGSNEAFAFIFRIGIANAPSARTTRKEPSIEFVSD